MIEFDKCEDKIRTLYIRFKCSRCGAEEFEKLQDCKERTGESLYLHQMRLPKDWFDDYHLCLCPDCKKAFDEFMKGSDAE